MADTVSDTPDTRRTPSDQEHVPTHLAAPSETRSDAETQTPPEQSGATSGGDAKWWTLAGVCTGVFMLLLDITIVNVALADIQTSLGASFSDVQWVIDAYSLSLAALLLTAGSLADLYGRRLLFVIGLVIFTVGSTACGAAQDVHFLWAARAFQGIGGAAMFATALALLASAFRGKDRGTAFGVFGATTGVAVAVGPVLGGVLTSYLSWRWIFFVNIPICLVAIAITVWKIKESHDPRAGRPDWGGFLSFSASLALLVYGLIEAGELGFGETRCVVSFIGAGFLFVVFLAIEIGAKDPMFDLSLLKKPTFTGGLFAAFGVSASIFSLLLYLVLYVQNVLGYSAVATGLRFLFLSGASFIAAAISGRLTSHVPTKWLIAPGFVLTGVGLMLIHGIADSADPGEWKHLIVGLTIAGLGVGMINAPLASTAVGVVSVDRSGMASGVNSTFRQVGIASGIAALGSIFAHQVTDKVSDALQGTPAAGSASSFGSAITNGQISQFIEQAPADQRQALGQAAVTGYTGSLNDIVLIGAIICFAAAVLTFALIRQKDFVPQGPPQAAAPTGEHGGSTDAGAAGAPSEQGAADGADDSADETQPIAAGAGSHARSDAPGKHLA